MLGVLRRGSPAPPGGPRRCASAASAGRRSRPRACRSPTLTISSSPLPGLADDVEAGLAEQQRDALAQQHRVVGEHYAHGISALQPGSSGGWTPDLQAAVERLDAVGEPAQAGAVRRVGAALAVVGDLDDQACRSRADVDVALAGLSVLGDVGQALGDQVVRGDLDRLAAGAPRASSRARRARARAPPATPARPAGRGR